VKTTYTLSKDPDRTTVSALKGIDIWTITATGTEPEGRRAFAELSASEQQRVARFRRPMDGARWGFFRTALRRVLASYAECAPADLVFDVVKNNKPVLRVDEDGDKLFFNLSHSRDMALLGITRLCPIGVDLEYSRYFDNMNNVAQRNFSALEHQIWSSGAREDQLACFYRCWTRKEAVIKALGLGLQAPLQAFDVPLHPDIDWTTITHRDPLPQDLVYSLRDIPAPGNYTAAVALCRLGSTAYRPHLTMYEYNRGSEGPAAIGEKCNGF
jgi:4'-phosphopantetheinyl transferase